MISAAFQLALRYVARHRWQSALLAGALGLVLALPLGIRVLVREAEAAMRSRALATPQVIGARGSALDLLLSALYFKLQPLASLPAAAVDEVRASGYGTAVPLHLRFHAQGAPIVGTDLDYFEARKLRLASGRMIARLGDCVVGAGLARTRRLGPGDHVFSSQEQVFDMAGVYPLKMRITGVLAANGTADDDAVFVDLKTAWLIQGFSHGHEDLAGKGEVTLTQEGSNTVGNAAVRMFNEVTDANLGSFHFHGDTGQYPISAILVFPSDPKAGALLEGRFLKADHPLQLIRPLEEFDELMRTLFEVEDLVLGVLALIAVAAVAVAALVFALSFRLRQRQFQTLSDLGVARASLTLTKLFEVALVDLAGGAVALALTVAVHLNADAWVRLLLK